MCENDQMVTGLIKCAKNGEVRVQRNAVGAILNLTHVREHRNVLVQANVIPTLSNLLLYMDPEICYYAVTALSNLAVDEESRLLMSKEHVYFLINYPVF